MIDYDARLWRRTLLQVTGTVAPRVMVRVAALTGWAVAVVYFHVNVVAVEAPSTVHTLVGVALGLLLVFRTNASYERFWEGRKLWAGITGATRNLGRTASAFLADQPHLLERTLLWGAGFPHAAKHWLRGEPPALGAAVTARLPADEVAETLAAQHPPAAVALRISDCLAQAWKTGTVTDRVAILIDAAAQQLVDQVSGCERIRDTPLPFAYVAHLRLALVLYCLTLPFALVGSFGWTTVLDTLLITYVLFGIEEIGVEVENPFGHDHNDLPLERFCEIVERELLALVAARGIAGAAAAAEAERQRAGEDGGGRAGSGAGSGSGSGINSGSADAGSVGSSRTTTASDDRPDAG